MGSKVIIGVIKKWGAVGGWWGAVYMRAQGAVAGVAWQGGGPLLRVAMAALAMSLPSGWGNWFHHVRRLWEVG